MKSKTLLFTIFMFLISAGIPFISTAQCQVEAYVYPDTVYAGDEVTINSWGYCGVVLAEGFYYSIPNSFSPTSLPLTLNNPCGPGPNSFHLWVDSGATQRIIETVDMNLSMPGTKLNWWMKYGSDSLAGSCNSLSTPNAGVHLQYSVDGGSNWTDFPGPNTEPSGNLNIYPPFIVDTAGSGGYWEPHALSDQDNNELYYWNEYSNDIPPAAATASTRLRWIQNGSFTHKEETWGIDEVEIVYPPGHTSVLWSTGDTLLSPPKVTIPQDASRDTFFIVTISDAYNNTATDTCFVTVLSGNSIQDFTVKNMVNVYPNPGAGNFIVELEKAENQAIKLQVYDLQGSLVHQSQFINKKKVALNLSYQPSGIYILNLQSGSLSAHRKLIISN